MNSNLNDQDQHQFDEQQNQQEGDYYQGGADNDNEILDQHQPGDTNQFAMDVNLNSFQSFSQADDPHQQHQQPDDGGDHHYQQQRRPFRKPGGRDEDEDKEILNKIFIGGIHPDTTEDSLKEHFAQYGNIIDHVIIKDPNTKRSRGFGFVKYSDSSAVDEVIGVHPF